MSQCEVDGAYEISIVPNLRAFEDCPAEQAQNIVAALARGENVHIAIEETAQYYHATVHVYGSADLGFVRIEEFSGCTRGCVSPYWRDAQSCGAIDRSYFADALENNRACSLIADVRDGWGAACVGGAVTCPRPVGRMN